MSKPKIRKDTLTFDVTTIGGPPEYVVNECWIVERESQPWTMHPTWTDAVRAAMAPPPLRMVDRRIFEAHEVPVVFSAEAIESLQHYPCQS